MDFHPISSIDGAFDNVFLNEWCFSTILFFQLYYFFNEVNCLEEYSMRITKLFEIKVVVLTLIISLFIFEYPKM